VGCAAASGLPVLAILTVAAYFAVSYAFKPLLDHLPALRRATASYRIVYRPGLGVLRELLDQCTHAGFVVLELRTLSSHDAGGQEQRESPVEVALAVQGQGDSGQLTVRLASVDGVLACIRGAEDE
jgi:putative Mg2+ transporter-C (MgtC) family protein